MAALNDDTSTFDLRRVIMIGGAGAALAAAVALRPGIVAFLAVIMVSVVAHEGGHFLVARRVGMRPTKFFAGMGPTVWSRRDGGVRWGLKLLPIGGFVTIPGMTASAEVDPALEPYTYRAAATWRRLVTIVAGPAVNLVIAAALFAVVAAVGYADSDGVRHGASFADSVSFGVRSTWGVVTSTLGSLWSLITAVPAYVADVATNTTPETRFLSPVGATRLTEQAAADDLVTFIGFSAVLNASLGVFNLLPLVPLDGGHASVAIAEKATSVVARRRVVFDAARLAPVAIGVIGVLVALSVSALWLDIAHPAANPFST